jgi:histone deacetylase 1/2
VKRDDKEKGALVSYGVDTNWYTDATHHLTRELSKLSTANKYKGRDQVHTADSNGMTISHIGKSILHTPHDSLHLKNIYMFLVLQKNLLSFHKLTLDNDVFLEFHPFFFFIKDRATRTTLFKGPYHGGLYPLVTVTSGASKRAFITIKPSSSTWHRRLEHPWSFVVHQVLRKHNIFFTPEINLYVCESCQLAKSHQLPYPVSTVHLEQVLSYEWSLAPVLVNKYSYYVSFIDDFSKFTWIYLLKKHYDVYQVFLNF